jgi:hypothetical protein
VTAYFVDPVAGDDASGGLGPETPWRTVARAARDLGAGDTLRLHAGAVYGPETVFPGTLAGTPEAPIVVEPYAGTEVHFDGRIRDPDLTRAPNAAWETVEGGHAEEWRTQILEDPQASSRDLARIRYGAFAGSRLRLITYARLEDLRATNESFHVVPLEDPRDGPGPLADDPTRKRPWAFFGPGLHWVFEKPSDAQDRRGRVHVRLSHTHLRTPGTRDYTGPTDPNRVGLALAPEGRVPVTVAASHVRFRGLVIANGGTTTLRVTQQARGVTFDHCTVYGGRYGVRVAGAADGVRFEHCTFDGALGPWTVRSDVKSEYRYLDALGRPVEHAPGNETHDILVISHAADNAESASCTLRRAHDALQIGGADVSVHHCFEETPCAWEITGATVVKSPAHTGRRALMMDPLRPGVARQRVPVSPGVRCRISAWLRRGAPLAPPVRVRAVFVDAGAPLESVDLPMSASTRYVHRAGEVVAPGSATAMDLFLGVDLQDSPAYFDDLRVFDGNLLVNGGFETPSPTGRDDEAPGWLFQAGGARVVDDPGDVPAGLRAVALEGIPGDSRQATQHITALTGVARYRVSAWLKTAGLTAAPTLVARFEGGGDQVVARRLSEGAYRFVSGEVAAPVGAARLTIRLHLERGASGTAYFDDVLVAPLG